MRALALAVGLALAALQAGCSSIAAWNFTKASASGAEKGKVALVFLGAKNGDHNSTLPDAIKNEIVQDSHFASAEKPCLREGIRTLSIPGPILGAIAQAGFNIWADAALRRIQDIVDSAQQSYSQTAAIDPADLQSVTCLLLLRYVEPEEGKPELGALALLKLERLTPPKVAQTSTFRIAPLYVRLNTAVAVTREAPQPTASLSLAISIKAIARDESVCCRRAKGRPRFQTWSSTRRPRAAVATELASDPT